MKGHLPKSQVASRQASSTKSSPKLDDSRPMTRVPISDINRTIFRRPFVKRFALCYGTVVCLSVCPDCNVGVLWPNGWMDQDETWHAGRPRPWPRCIRWGPCSSPKKKGAQPPNFQPMSTVAKRSPILATAEHLYKNSVNLQQCQIMKQKVFYNLIQHCTATTCGQEGTVSRENPTNSLTLL